jgi:nucleoside-diphosphate-sugar epimerase
MRVLVTGATGFVGRAVVGRLVAERHTVHALVRRPDAEADMRALGAQPFAGTVGDPNEVAAAAAGCDAVVHAAAVTSHRAAAEALEWVNVAGTENVVEAARHEGCRRLVFISCADVTLTIRDRVHWNEDHDLSGHPVGAHARTKRMAEELVVCASTSSFCTVALRPAVLWGPGDTTTLPGLCAEAAAGGVRLFGSGTNLVSTTYIEHLVDAVLAALVAEGVTARTYHVVDGEFLEAGEFYGALCQAAGLPAPCHGAPFPLAYVGAWLRERLGGAGPWRTDVLRRARSTYLDHGRAVNELGYEPRVPFTEGMERVATWIREVGGPSAVAALARPPCTAEEVSAQIALAQAGH